VLSIGVLQLYTWEEMMTLDSHRSRLANVLPALLTRFRLHIDNSLQNSRRKSWYGVLVQILDGLVRDVKSGLPHLGTIVVQISCPFYEIYYDEFAGLITAFAQEGVRFRCETQS